MKLADILLIVAIFAIIYADPSLTSALTDAGDDLSNYTIRFGGYRIQQDTYVTTDGLVIPEGDSFYSITVDNFCKCRIACWSYATCQAASSEPFEGKFLCRLSTKSPVDTDLKILGDATYIYFTSVIVNRFYGIESDGFLYLLTDIWTGHNNASATCRKIPGHRLGMYDTPAQVQAIKNVLQRNPSGNMRAWTDHEINGEKQYINTGGNFIYRDIYPNAGVVCQANPFGYK